MTWIDEFRPRNKTIWVVFDQESEFSGPRMSKLSPDQVFRKSVPDKKTHILIALVRKTIPDIWPDVWDLGLV